MKIYMHNLNIFELVIHVKYRPNILFNTLFYIL